MNPGRWSRRRLSRSVTHARPYPWLLVGIVALLLATAPVGAGVTVGVQNGHGGGPDNIPPVLAEGERINDTAIELTITDNHDVDESTIQSGDFVLETGSIRNISVTESGSNATVTVLLTRRINEDDLTVALRSGSPIADANGNSIDTDGADSYVIVSNMDGVSPAVREFTVTNATGTPATIRLEATEQLRDFNISVSGAGTDYLNSSGFESADPGISYERTYLPPGDGTAIVALDNLTDEAGNTRRSAFSEQILVDLTPPDPVAALDFGSSAGRTIAFDGRRSTDANGVANYTWAFGDGTTATGPRVSHTYAPGNYTVSLNVSDPYGNAATDTLTLNLTNGTGNVSDVDEPSVEEEPTGLEITVDRPSQSVTDEAIVAVRNARRGERVQIGAVDGNGTALVRRGPVSLDGLAVTPASNRSVSLGLSMLGGEAVGDAADPTGTRPLAGFSVANSVPDSDIENATIRFSVDRDRLQSLGVTADNVALFRDNGSWERLDTTALNATGERQPFRAATPGFSRFAITAAGEASLGMTNATVAESSVSPGQQVSVTATVENNGTVDGTYTAGLAVNGSVAATESRSVAAGETVTIPLATTMADPGRYELTVNGTVAGTVTVEAPEQTEETEETEETPEETQVENATQTATGGNATESADGDGGNDGDDGGLFAPISGLLAALPMGLLRPLVLFVVLPAVVIVGALKGLALYMGY